VLRIPDFAPARGRCHKNEQQYFNVPPQGERAKAVPSAEAGR
jgi:hypothetical protein